MTRPLSSKARKDEFRRLRALGVRQDFLCLKIQGFVIHNGKQMSPEEYRAVFLRDLHYLITRRMGLAPKLNRGNNADRAADILRHGSKSRWWFARDSDERSGDDMRGIKWWLAKWKRERGITPRA